VWRATLFVRHQPRHREQERNREQPQLDECKKHVTLPEREQGATRRAETQYCAAANTVASCGNRRALPLALANVILRAPKMASSKRAKNILATTKATSIGSRVCVLALFVLYPLSFSRAQLHSGNARGVTMAQLRYSVRDVEANEKFWIALGGTPAHKLDDSEVVKFPGVLILLSRGEPSGGTEGSVVNHVGFRVPSVDKIIERMKTAGYKTERNAAFPTGNVYTPDGDRIEMLEALTPNLKYTLDDGRKDFEAERNNRAMTAAIEFHHIHYSVPQSSVAEVKAWYVRTFGAVPGLRLHYEAADLPGAEVDILGVTDALAPTKGRTLDRIGFEVANLHDFCQKLQADGAKLTAPYEKRSSGIATAEFTDPWGVTIELSEGLDRL
jgi:catechol 2,3-dioxygenase-like lactoylglutathione lyase family enzyme